MKAITNLNSSWMSWEHRPLMNSTPSLRDDQRNISVLLLLERRFRLGNCTLKPRRKLLISWIILWLVCLFSPPLSLFPLPIIPRLFFAERLLPLSPASSPLFRRTIAPTPTASLSNPPRYRESELINSRPSKEVHSRRMPSPPLPLIIPWSRGRTSR